ncbi:MAG TPA: DUF1990 domain-containing protein [Pyrinomonadaceae bacterium]|nr:DUF1990 domain-containing protein [Pyrinomonadaceae bacterium]
MLLLAKPDNETIGRFLDAQKNAAFSYAEVGASRSASPPGYNIDHNRTLIANGRENFRAAVGAIREWKMFDMPWVELHPPDPPIEPDTTVAIVVRHFGFWSINAARIVYVIDEVGDVEKFGFAYGTLAEHAESGEERFSVEFHHASGEVWYDLFAFSRPNHFLARLGYPLSRMLQRRFAEDSKQAMGQAMRGREFFNAK